MISVDRYTLQGKEVPVGDGHNLETKLWGTQATTADPLIFLHGGPGGSSSDTHKRLFDPDMHQVLFVDQRGCGASTPYGSLEHNTTDHLVQDITKVADEYGFDKFGLVGNSWGSCLSLIYAIRNSERVSRLAISGIFTARDEEVDHLYKGGWRRFFPNLWEEFVASVPRTFRESAGYYHMETSLSDDPRLAKLSAYRLSELGGALLSISEAPMSEPFESFDPAGTIMQSHYDSNNEFIPEGYILQNASQLDMRVDIVQGRYDMICPPITAIKLAEHIPQATLKITSAGHYAMDRENLLAMRQVLAT